MYIVSCSAHSTSNFDPCPYLNTSPFLADSIVKIELLVVYRHLCKHYRVLLYDSGCVQHVLWRLSLAVVSGISAFYGPRPTSLAKTVVVKFSMRIDEVVYHVNIGITTTTKGSRYSQAQPFEDPPHTFVNTPLFWMFSFFISAFIIPFSRISFELVNKPCSFLNWHCIVVPLFR